MQTAKASRKQSSLSGKESAQGCPSCRAGAPVCSPWGLCPLVEGPWSLPLLIASLGFSSRGTWGRVVPSCRGLQGTETFSAPLWPPLSSNSQLWPGSPSLALQPSGPISLEQISLHLHGSGGLTSKTELTG